MPYGRRVWHWRISQFLGIYSCFPEILYRNVIITSIIVVNLVVGKWQKNLVLETKFVCLMKTGYSAGKHIARASSVYKSISWGRIWDARALSLISPLQWYFVMLLPSSFLHVLRSFHSLKLTSIPAMIFLFDGMNLVTFNEGSALIPWNWPATIFLFHDMNLVTFNEGSAYLLFTILFKVY
jgi:hypothetical protein